VLSRQSSSLSAIDAFGAVEEHLVQSVYANNLAAPWCGNLDKLSQVGKIADPPVSAPTGGDTAAQQFPRARQLRFSDSGNQHVPGVMIRGTLSSYSSR
jgi:hypothetical protein